MVSLLKKAMNCYQTELIHYLKLLDIMKDRGSKIATADNTEALVAEVITKLQDVARCLNDALTARNF